MTHHQEALLEALTEMRAAVIQNRQLLAVIENRIELLSSALRSRHPAREVLLREEQPVLLQLLTEAILLMQNHGTRVRQTEAQLLYSEGLSMDEVADLFGVSRQRVSKLINDANGSAP